MCLHNCIWGGKVHVCKYILKVNITQHLYSTQCLAARVPAYLDVCTCRYLSLPLCIQMEVHVLTCVSKKVKLPLHHHLDWAIPFNLPVRCTDCFLTLVYAVSLLSESI